jgi:hypothetical protein
MMGDIPETGTMTKRLFRPSRVTDSAPAYPTSDEFVPQRRNFLRHVGAACLGVGLGLHAVGEAEAAPKDKKKPDEDKKKPDEDKKKPDEDKKKRPPPPLRGEPPAPRAAIDDEEIGD